MTYLKAAWYDEAEADAERVERPGWMRSAFGAIGLGKRKVQRVWSEWIDLGPHMRVQAKGGTKAAVVKLKEGQYLVTEVPAEDLSTFGADYIGAGIISEAGGALAQLIAALDKAGRRRPQGGPAPVPQLPAAETDDLSGWRW